MARIILADAAGNEVGTVRPDDIADVRRPFAEEPVVHTVNECRPVRDFAELLEFMQGPRMPDVPMTGTGGPLLDVLEQIRKGQIGGPVELPNPNNPFEMVSSSYLRTRGGWWERDMMPPVYSPGNILVEGVEQDGNGPPIVRFRILNNPAWERRWHNSWAGEFNPGPTVPEDTAYTYGGGEGLGYANFPERPSGRRQGRRMTKKERALWGMEGEDAEEYIPDTMPIHGEPA